MAIVQVNGSIDTERFLFGGRLPRSAEFALMLENINRVEETPATKRRRQFTQEFRQIIRPEIWNFYGKKFHSGGVVKPRLRYVGE